MGLSCYIDTIIIIFLEQTLTFGILPSRLEKKIFDFLDFSGLKNNNKTVELKTHQND